MRRAYAGRIPSPYNEDFVKGLLQAEQCVCDRPLNRHRRVECGSGSAQERFDCRTSWTSGSRPLRIEVLKESRAEAPRQLQDLARELAVLKTQEMDLELKIGEVSKKLEDHPVAEIQEREVARRELAKKLEKDKERRIRLAIENENDEKFCKQLAAEISGLSRKNDQARRLVLRRDVSQKLKDGLGALLKDRDEEGARQEIEATVNRILEATARRHYVMRIDDSFELKLFFANNKPAPKSSGENQLMSLAFIAALVQFAQKTNRGRGPRSSDTGDRRCPSFSILPFGQLDDQYRSDTASFVPKMAPQVVLLVSSSQGKQEVIERL